MGPVPLSKGLAVALMSDPRGPPDPESLFRGERDVYAGIRLAKNIVRPVIRARTLRRLHGVIKTWNLPPHRRRVVKIPAEIPRSHVRQFFSGQPVSPALHTACMFCLGLGTDHLHVYKEMYVL